MHCGEIQCGVYLIVIKSQAIMMVIKDIYCSSDKVKVTEKIANNFEIIFANIFTKK